MRVTLQAVDKVTRQETILTSYKQETIGYINLLAGQVRSKFMTTSTGQELLYMMKRSQALRYLANPEGDPLDFILILFEMQVFGSDGTEVANLWLSSSEDWDAMAASLETIRLGCIDVVQAPGATRTICDTTLVNFIDAIDVFGSL